MYGNSTLPTLVEVDWLEDSIEDETSVELELDAELDSLLEVELEDCASLEALLEDAMEELAELFPLLELTLEEDLGPDSHATRSEAANVKTNTGCRFIKSLPEVVIRP